jgi:hypothetical protein
LNVSAQTAGRLFLLDGGGELRGAHGPQAFQASVHGAIKAYLAAHPVIAPVREDREGAIDLPRAVFSQDAVLAGGDVSTVPATPSGLPE